MAQQPGICIKASAAAPSSLAQNQKAPKPGITGDGVVAAASAGSGVVELVDHRVDMQMQMLVQMQSPNTATTSTTTTPPTAPTPSPTTKPASARSSTGIASIHTTYHHPFRRGVAACEVCPAAHQ